MLKHLILAFALTCCVPLTRAEKPSWEYPNVEMRGWHAQAVAIALREFRGKPGERPYGDLRHYTVKIILRSRDEVDVVFAPDHGPKDWKKATTGGVTQYGAEVSYRISAKDLKITKTMFAR